MADQDHIEPSLIYLAAEAMLEELAFKLGLCEVDS
jgi:hypothetical protein